MIHPYLTDLFIVSGDKDNLLGAVARTFVLEVMGSIPAHGHSRVALTENKSRSETNLFVNVTITRPNSLIGRDFVITGCLT